LSSATSALPYSLTPGTPSAPVRFFARLSKKLVLLIPISMLLGLVAGLLLDLSPLKAAILPITMLMVYPMLVNFRPVEAVNFRHGRALALAMGLNFAVVPVAAWLLARTFFSGDPGLFVGMILAGLFPTSGMTISWTGFAKGNVAAAVKMTVIGLLAAAVLSPVYLWLLAGQRVEVDLAGVSQTVLLVVLVPMLLGSLTRRTLVARYGPSRYKAEIAPIFPGLSTAGVVAIVFLAVGLKAKMIVSAPALLARVAVPLVLFYAFNFAAATLAGRLLLNREDAIAAVYGSVMRNLSIALGIAIASFGPMAALVLAVAYIVQVQSAAWYVKLSDNVFGPHQEPAEEPGAVQVAPA